MNEITNLHQQAMEFADRAFMARRTGDPQAGELTRRAFELERSAAELVRGNLQEEPTRSVLHRSAASLAIDCGELREAERLIAWSLAGNPPNEIAEELRDLLEQVGFNRHLELRNISLSANELQMSIAGPDIGAGLALSEVFIDRVKDVERMIHRTAERLLGNQFRDHGPAKQSIQVGYSLYLSAPRAGSFAVTMRIGRQEALPGFGIATDVLSEVIECLDLLSSGNEEELKTRIHQEPYYQNFVGLAKRLAPDGQSVNFVGITTTREGKEVTVKITRRRDEFIRKQPKLGTRELKRFVTVKGRLRLADARRQEGKIELIDEAGKATPIIVPEGMMNDIVRPLWDDAVEVDGERIKRKVYLRDIRRATEPSLD